MPWLIIGGASLLGGLIAGVSSQVDDALEGGQKQVNTLLVVALLAGALYFYNKKGKK